MKIKTGYLLVIFIFCVSCIIGCGNKNKDAKKENVENTLIENVIENIEIKNKEEAEKISSYDTFILEGEKITLPISWSELAKMGFEIGDVENEVLSEDLGYIEGNIYNSDGTCLGTISIGNKTVSDNKVIDGKVSKLTLNKNANLYFYQGLSFLSTKEQMYEICGQPLYQIYEKVDDNSIVRFCEMDKLERKKALDNDPEFEVVDSYAWCKEQYMKTELVYNEELGVYESIVLYHYLRPTFADDGSITEIEFYFNCAEEENDM